MDVKKHPNAGPAVWLPFLENMTYTKGVFRKGIPVVTVLCFRNHPHYPQ